MTIRVVGENSRKNRARDGKWAHRGSISRSIGRCEMSLSTLVVKKLRELKER